MYIIDSLTIFFWVSDIKHHQNSKRITFYQVEYSSGRHGETNINLIYRKVNILDKLRK